MKRRKLFDQSLLEKRRQRSRKSIVESRKRVHSFKRQEGSTKIGVTNEKISDPRQGPPENCVIGVGTGQIDGSNAGFAREQWDRVAWKQRLLTHCARTAGSQIRNRQRHKRTKPFSQKTRRRAPRLRDRAKRKISKERQRQGIFEIESQDP